MTVLAASDHLIPLKNLGVSLLRTDEWYEDRVFGFNNEYIVFP